MEQDSHWCYSHAVRHSTHWNKTVTGVTVMQSDTAHNGTRQSLVLQSCSQTQHTMEQDSQWCYSHAVRHCTQWNKTVTGVTVMQSDTEHNGTRQSLVLQSCSQTLHTMEQDSHWCYSHAVRHCTQWNKTVTGATVMQSDTAHNGTRQSLVLQSCSQTLHTMEQDSHWCYSHAVRHCTQWNKTVTGVTVMQSDTAHNGTRQSLVLQSCSQTLHTMEQDSHWCYSHAVRHSTQWNKTVTGVTVMQSDTAHNGTRQSLVLQSCSQTLHTMKCVYIIRFVVWQGE